MNKIYYLIVFLFFCRISYSQNLVPNGSFELYSSCPSGYSQIDSCNFWTAPNISSSISSDYFNSCALVNSISVPMNNLGYQQPHSGQAYSGIILGYGFQVLTLYREYIEVPLLTPLIANTCYHFEMFVSLGFCRYTTNEIGAYLSDSAIIGVTNYDPLPFVPQINNPIGNSFDTLNWTLVSGVFTASGGEKYLTIGNFKNDSNTTYTYFNVFQPLHYVYVYIDDVALCPCSSSCFSAIEEQTQKTINIFPNPFDSKFDCEVNFSGITELILYDSMLRKIFSHNFINFISITTEMLAKGIYIYEVRNKNGVIKFGKIIKA